MSHLDKLESISIYIFREAYANFKNLGMLWSMGKDSTVLLWLARKAFFGHIPFSVIHIDTGCKIPEMIEYRDRLTREWNLPMIYGVNEEAIKNGQTFLSGSIDRLTCCRLLKTETLQKTLKGGIRYRFNHREGRYVVDENSDPFTGIIVGIRADEEGTRSKERYFSPRDKEGIWGIGKQPPEIWDQYNTDFKPGTHIRIHPLLDWTELDVWEYIKKKNIPTISLYYNNGNGKRYRSLGCYPCTSSVCSEARNADEIIEELKNGKFANIPERSGRAQDEADGRGLETLRRNGYM
ncbi:sulfate adenylyltransferase subunit CysD [Candidatus Omnitrophota bacterium]